MKFLLDESADYPLAPYLKTLGHDVKTITIDFQRALPDKDVLAIAKREKRILITNDRDFGELIFRQNLSHAGVILFRLGEESLETKKTALNTVLTKYAHELRHFIVVTPLGVRIRRQITKS